MGDIGVIDVLEVQERKGHARAKDGLDETKFLEYCQDIQDQPQWRKQADKADEYYDGNQIDPDTMQGLQDLGLPELICNLVKPTIDVVLGMEAKTRTDWRVTADSDTLQDVAEALSEKLHESERESRADRACSDAYAAQVKSGIGWVEVSRNQDPFKYPHRVGAIHRREIEWDWRDRETDLQGSRYLIRRRWFDIDEAKVYFPRHKELIEAAGTGWGAWWLNRMTESAELMQSFEQDRGWTLEEWEYRDTVRRRICLYETWYRQLRRGYVLKLPDNRVVEMNLDNPLHAMAVARELVKPIPAIYSKWGMAIFAGPHKMLDCGCDRKRHPYVPFWGYRESLTGMPYGLIRGMISPQDEVNARRRKLMHLLSAVRLIVDSDALDTRYNSIRDVIDEIARADALVVMNPARANKQGAIQIDQNLQLSEAQYKIMVNAEEMLQKVAGVFNAMLGRDSTATSGIAIDSLVEQGATVLAEINDNYRFARRLVGESLLELVKEDIGRDEVEVMVGEPGRRKVVVLNHPVPDPELGNIVTLENAVQQAGVRVTLDDVPSSASYRKQQFTMLAEVVKGLSPEAQAVLTPYLLEQSDLPKRQKMADELRQVLNLPMDGEENPQVQMLTQQVQQLTAMLEQAQAALKDKRDFENKKLDIEARKVGIQAQAEQFKRLDSQQKAIETSARAESIKADTARKDAEFALNAATQQFSTQQEPQQQGGQGEGAASTGNAEARSLLAAMEELQGAIASMAADAGSPAEEVRDQLAQQLREVIAIEAQKMQEAEERTAQALAQMAARQEEMRQALVEELNTKRALAGVQWLRDKNGNAIGGVADYGDRKRAFKVIRGKDGAPTRLEFEEEEQ